MQAPAYAGGGGHCPDPLPEVQPGKVVILDSCFAPANPTIATGEVLTWEMAGSAKHTVTFGSVNFGDIASSFRAKFNQPGTFDYRCIYHPGMVAAVTVTGPDLGGEPIEALSPINDASLGGTKPVIAAGADSVAKGQVERVRVEIDAAGGLMIGAALIVMAIASAAASTVAVRLARR